MRHDVSLKVKSRKLKSEEEEVRRKKFSDILHELLFQRNNLYPPFSYLFLRPKQLINLEPPHIRYFFLDFSPGVFLGFGVPFFKYQRVAIVDFKIIKAKFVFFLSGRYGLKIFRPNFFLNYCHIISLFINHAIYRMIYEKRIFYFLRRTTNTRSSILSPSPTTVCANVISLRRQIRCMLFANDLIKSSPSLPVCTSKTARSFVVNPSFFRRSWIFLTSSRNCPSFLSSGVIVVSTITSCSIFFSNSTFFTFISSLISCSSSLFPFNFSLLTFKLNSGCRTLIPAFARASRPSDATLFASAISSTRRLSEAFIVSPLGQRSRCTLSSFFFSFTF